MVGDDLPLDPTERESAISRDRRCRSQRVGLPRKKRPGASASLESSFNGSQPRWWRLPLPQSRGRATLQRALLQRCATRVAELAGAQASVCARGEGSVPLAHNTTTDEAFAERSVGRSLPQRTAHRFGVVRPRPAWWSPPLTGRGRSILRERKVRSSAFSNSVVSGPDAPNRLCVSLLRQSVHVQTLTSSETHPCSTSAAGTAPGYWQGQARRRRSKHRSSLHRAQLIGVVERNRL